MKLVYVQLWHIVVISSYHLFLNDTTAYQRKYDLGLAPCRIIFSTKSNGYCFNYYCLVIDRTSNKCMYGFGLAPCGIPLFTLGNSY